MLRHIALLAILATAFAADAVRAQEATPTRRILALGGNGFRDANRAVPRYFLSLTGKPNPVVYFLPTAVGDSDREIVAFYDVMNELECRPRHLKLFSESQRMKNLEQTLLSADAIYVNGGNTMNMLAVWKAHGVDKILRKAYDRGIVLGGESAGMICWFEQGCSDSRAEKLSAIDCLGFLKGSACPHYAFEFKRRPAYHKMIRAGELKDGIACDDDAILLYENEQLARIFRLHKWGAGAFEVQRKGNQVVEKAIKSEVLPAQPSVVARLWPGRPPGDLGIDGDEKFFQLMIKGKPHEVAGKPTKWLTNVATPTISVYPMPLDQFEAFFEEERPYPPRPAVIICPGGGYHNLGWDVEGTEIADWLNSIGVVAVVLKYRCPRRPGDEKGVPPIGPLKDAQRAVSLVRAKAKEWNIDPKKIGMVGFSAGGHLVGATCTNFEARAYAPIDDVDQVSCRPDFGIMCYSGYFKVKEGEGLSPTVKTPKDAPPLFFAHAKDDAISAFGHSATFHQALKAAKLDSELHLFETGGHGWGVRPGNPAASWKDRCVDWMRNRGIVRGPAKK